MIGAGELAALLGQPPPTDEQRAVIEAPLSPALVVAGAGSGKTETMANRVIWLLANRQVRVGEVLGLTFTRKAAGELAKRIAERVGQLEVAGLLPFQEDTLEQATVSTYNAFASLGTGGLGVNYDYASSILAAHSGPSLYEDPVVIHPPNSPLGHTDEMYSLHPGGANVLMGDGSVRFIKQSINLLTWQALSSRNNGEVISADAY